MQREDLQAQLARLVTGLATEEIGKGNDFFYGGSKLYPDEVADLMLPSIVCIAQDVAARVGLGGFGFVFRIGQGSPSSFPLVMEREDDTKRFFEIAPFVVEVFEAEVVECRHDLVKLFESAARLVQSDFRLEGGLGDSF
ncbi:hypothetical protein RCH14_004445 [Massilia sp. MP_M2]|uniref:hypothetical protein n=1 Tax=Massilia sp. MP_M2 TaxID=3071713 RepID=UPI00319E6E62